MGGEISLNRPVPRAIVRNNGARRGRPDHSRRYRRGDRSPDCGGAPCEPLLDGRPARGRPSRHCEVAADLPGPATLELGVETGDRSAELHRQLSVVRAAWPFARSREQAASRDHEPGHPRPVHGRDDVGVLDGPGRGGGPLKVIAMTSRIAAIKSRKIGRAIDAGRKGMSAPLDIDGEQISLVADDTVGNGQPDHVPILGFGEHHHGRECGRLAAAGTTLHVHHPAT